ATSGVSTSNSYDSAGNQTGRTSGVETFSWDAESRLSSATVSGIGYSMTYNGDGLRTDRTTNVAGQSALDTRFLWDLAATLPVILYDNSGDYVYGAGLVARILATGTVYYLADGQGSVLALVD